MLSTLGEVAENLDSQRLPVNRAERAERVGPVPYYGATGRVGWIDEPLFDEELCWSARTVRRSSTG